MTLRIRPATLKDFPAIEALYRGQSNDENRSLPAGVLSAAKQQAVPTRMWSLLTNTFAAILPITSTADYVYVGESLPGGKVVGFVQAQVAPAGKHVWQILNLCLRPELDRFQAGTALLDHLCNEGLRRGAIRFIVRIALGDHIADLFRTRGFRSYATEQVLLAESLAPRPVPEVAGWRSLRRQDQLALYLLYRAAVPKEVSSVEGATFKEWRQSFQQGWWTSRLPRTARQRQFVVDRTPLVGWMGLTPGSGTRPHTLGLMALPEAQVSAELVQRSLAYVAQHWPGPVWCTLRHYEERLIQALQRERFEIVASQVLMVRELALKVPVRARVKVREKKLMPQYG